MAWLNLGSRVDAIEYRGMYLHICREYVSFLGRINVCATRALFPYACSPPVIFRRVVVASYDGD